MRLLFLDKLIAAHQAGRLSFIGDNAHLADTRSFAALLAPLRKTQGVVYSKRPFGGPDAVLAYLSRYTHRVAIASSRLIACDLQGVTSSGRTIVSRAAMDTSAPFTNAEIAIAIAGELPAICKIAPSGLR